MSKSIISDERRCYLCGRRQHLERHHVFGAAKRKRADHDGLTVYLCHDCHNEPPHGVHHNAETDRQLKQVGQAKWMRHYGRSKADFIAAYGKNYLD